MERMPSCAVSRPATSSMLISPFGRGAGPPNRVSTACCCASPALKPAVPATGGARLKSGGTISGALRATANSSGVCLWAQPATAVATRSTAAKALRMFDSLLGAFLTVKERAQQQDDDGNANRRVSDIEDQERPPFPEMEVGEVGDVAMADAVEDVSERAAEHHAQRDLIDPALLSPDPHCDGDGDRGRHRDQHPAPDCRRRVEQAERDAVVLGVGEVEEGHDHQLIADMPDAQRTGDDPLHELVERKDDERYKEAETARFHPIFPTFALTRSVSLI